MPTAYTPGLRVTADVTLRKERRLPLAGEVLVKDGDRVAADTIVARANIPGLVHPIKVSEVFDVHATEIGKFVVRQVGDAVQAGDVIASQKAMFGLFKTEVKAPVDGTVDNIDTTAGYVGIREYPKPIEVNAYVAGHIVETIPQEGVIVETRGAFIQGIFGVGGEQLGELKVPVARHDAILEPGQLELTMAGDIVVCGATATPALLKRAAEVGLAGVIVGAIEDEALRELVGYNIGVAITGQEDVPFSLICTEGFGSLPIADRTFELFQHLQGKLTSINGATQIRAGVIRPEIIVPDLQALASGAGPAAEEVVQQELVPGARVRVIREPYFGRLATVTELPSELQVIDTGARVRVARVAVNGEVVTVPRANLEIIQE